MSSCVLSAKKVSCSNLVLMCAQDLPTEIAVKRETTSKEIIVSSSSIIISVISFLNCVQFANEGRICDKNLIRRVVQSRIYPSDNRSERLIFLVWLFSGSSYSRYIWRHLNVDGDRSFQVFSLSS